MKTIKLPVLTALFLWICCILQAGTPPVFPKKRKFPTNNYAKNPAPLPAGYREYKFGMDRLKVVDLVKKDPKLRSYDADFIEGFELENWTVLVAVGPPYFKNVFFLFYKKKLFCVMIAFNDKKYSYQEIMNSLGKKYGRPNMLGLDVTIWQDKKVRIQLEQTIHLKYLDLEKFKQIKKEFRADLLKKKIDKYSILKNL